MSKSFFRIFLDSLYRGKKPTLVGKDHHGNNYFEIIADPERGRRGQRYVEAKDQHLKDQFEKPELPVEWESWLRGKRKVPPTEEEIKRNYVKMMQTKMRAAELDKKLQPPKAEKVDSKVPVENVTKESFTSSFPKYDDYEISPGHKRDT